MNIFDRMYAILGERERLIANAEKVAPLETILELGVLAAQLGLTPDELQVAVREYVQREWRNDRDS